MMCEIPNNVLQADAFAKLFDGFSIGSNDLTQLTLGIDRDSDIVAELFDERDPGVLDLIRGAVETARRNGIYSGLCGQAPSDHPEMARFLVELGIESISLNPDTVLKTTRAVLEIEAERKPKTPRSKTGKKTTARRPSPARKTPSRVTSRAKKAPQAAKTRTAPAPRVKPKRGARGGGGGRGARPKR